MKTDWKELTMQEKKAGAYNSPTEPLSFTDGRMTYPGVDKSAPELARGIGAPARPHIPH